MIKIKNCMMILFACIIGVCVLELPANAETYFSASAKCRPGQQVSIHITANTYDIDGFDIYRADAMDGQYSLIGTMDFYNNSAYTYRDNSDDSDYEYSDYYDYSNVDRYVFWDKDVHELYKTYYYQISMFDLQEVKCTDCPCAVEGYDWYCDCNCHSTAGQYQKVYMETVNVSVYILPDGPVITYGKRSGKTNARIKWSTTDGVDGYFIYCAANYDSESNYIDVQIDDETEFKLVKTITNPSTNSATFKKLMSGVTYTYRIYSYKEVNGVKELSISSEPKSVVMDYYSNSSETYEQRIKRAFGSEKKMEKNFKTASKASKQMKTIKIKVWDFKNGKNGTKVTRTKYLTVNKRLAASIKAMFDEIYKCKEKQVIHDIGCYSYRTGEHMYGMAIDINANENYMVDGKKILAGSFWNPKKSKYSIPLECETVRIMERYGFYRGFWGNRKDYMHFSYFGT